ncbi:MAG: prolyl oligopeptidase family serine peptidase [Thermosynechococcaceae cyanobacterium]
MAAVAPYGSWTSPITSELIVSGSIGLGDLALDGDTLYWTELRPTEKGRSVLVQRTVAGQSDVTPVPWNVRSRVHEYGGGAYTVQNGTAYFVNNSDQRIYRQVGEQAPEPLTSESDCDRYADIVIDAQRNRLICIQEKHQDAVINTLVSIDLKAEASLQTLAEGHDFYASPCLSPDGTQLAWLTWDNPNMPWDGTELWLATVTAAGLSEPQCIAGGPDESVFQPQWSPDGQLYFVSDRTGWWNLYRWRDKNAQPLCPRSAEFGLPQWVFGMTTYGFISATEILCNYNQQGQWRLGRLAINSGKLTEIETPYTDISGIKVGNTIAAFKGSSPTRATEIVQLNLQTQQQSVICSASSLEVDPGYLSVPELLEFPTENNLTAYGFYYPPTNQDYQGPATEKPPLLVKSHGGPTAATSSSLSLKIQYWTSRGFAVLDVNYGGSTGYGRAYQHRLRDQWGIVDVDDCTNGAKYLAQQGLVDGNRMTITGSSAGGYTTLAALTFKDVFKAGASYYGIGDLEALAKDTHKFEARYLDRLIGPYPERQDLYKERSPINHVEQLSCPVIFLQGLEDKVVPPNQAEAMVNALKAKGIPVAYVTFPEEQHGFRQAENIKRSLDSELYFYGQVFGFAIADNVSPITITNLGPASR